MDHDTDFTDRWTVASQREFAESILDQAWQVVRPILAAAIIRFLAGPTSPTSMLKFERAIFEAIRTFGRLIMESVLNQLEPASREEMPHDVLWQGSGYRVLRDKTVNRHVATLFGTICLARRGYRYWHRGIPEPTIFPLELKLGLVEGVTPALGDRIGKQLAASGSSQSFVIEWLRTDHAVAMGVKRLRAFTQKLSQGMQQVQLPSQVKTLLDALHQANESSGNRKPVLSVGRDGITLREYQHRFYEVGTVGTVTVFDRSGKRLATVYLAHTPEPNQVTMSAMIETLLVQVLTAWQGPLPQLAYVADCGDNESSFFHSTLKKMKHPVTGKRLHWQRVVDYYHVAERIWTIAGSLFGQGTKESIAWANRMLKALKKPSGASRVLHSAATFRHRLNLSRAALKEYSRACAYIRKRTKFMRYDQYQAAHIPMGSGITEAACKTVFTQRMKLSGMRWTEEGAQRILTLRTTLLSKHWDDSYNRHLDDLSTNLPRTYKPPNAIHAKLAA